MCDFFSTVFLNTLGVANEAKAFCPSICCSLDCVLAFPVKNQTVVSSRKVSYNNGNYQHVFSNWGKIQMVVE